MEKPACSKRRREDEDEDGISKVDRISELPQPIVHHILCFLPQKKAAKTCVLSKSWRYLWSARPKIEFRQSGSFQSRLPTSEQFYIKANIQTFLSALHKTLQAYHHQELRIREFIVSMPELDSDSVSLLQKWIPIVIFNMRVKQFELSFGNASPHFDLPSLVFEADELSKLSLGKCIINDDDDSFIPKLKHLQALHLWQVHVAEQTLNKILSGCPLIVTVYLNDCEGFRSFKLSNNNNNNLKHFVFCSDNNNNDDAVSIQIGVPTIRTIQIRGGASLFTHQKLHFSNLTCLYLINLRLPKLFSCNLPCLELLLLRCCKGVEEFNLLTRRPLKELIILFMERPFKAIIDAPSIISFIYTGSIPQSISCTTTTTTASNEHRKSKIKLISDADIDNDASEWFDKLNQLLKASSQSEISLLLLESDRSIPNRQLEIEDDDNTKNNVDDDDDKLAPAAVVVENLELMSWGQYLNGLSLPGFINCLFCTCHPRYIRMYLYPPEDTESGPLGRGSQENQVAEFLRKILLKEIGGGSYFWQRVLEEVNMQVFDTDMKKWQHVESVKSLLECGGDFRFALKWREDN